MIVLTGPSGVGKGTLVRALRARHPELFLSVSATTRSPRPGEVDGEHYYFMTREQFEALIQQKELLEYAQYVGNYYGTPRAAVIEKLEQGVDVLLEIEVEGARQVAHTFPEALRIFLLPPSEEELKNRLVGRGTDTAEAIEHRLTRAQQEIRYAPEFTYRVVNDDLEQALQAIEAILYPLMR
ncbi:MAG: guanylate kinase [Gloeobacterales cyanobacterium]